MRRILSHIIPGLCLLMSLVGSSLVADERSGRIVPIEEPGLGGVFRSEAKPRVDLLKRAIEGPGDQGRAHRPRPTPGYRLTFLEAPANAWSVPFDINDRGDVSGNVYPDDHLYDSGMFVWRHARAIEMGSYGSPQTAALQINNRGQVIVADNIWSLSGALWESGTFRDLGSLGTEWMLPKDLNDGGDVVGYGGSFFPNETRGFHYRDGVLTDLGDDFGPVAINNRGQIVGIGASATTGNGAMLWERGQLTELGAWGYATDINEAGDIVGWQWEASGRRAFLWSNGELTLLGPAGYEPGLTIGTTTLPEGPFISARGDVAWTLAFSDDVGTVFESFRWRRGVLERIPGVVFGINDRGTAVGTSLVNVPATTAPLLAFTWDDEVTTLAPPDGYSATLGLGINNRGDVIGCVVEGNARAVVWSPRYRGRGCDGCNLAHEAVAPSPTQTPIVLGDGVRFAVRSDLSGPVEVAILDVTGRVVTRYEGAIEPGTGHLYWDGRAEGSPVRAGVYFARASDANGRQAGAKAVVVR